jgi:hypothetical protein
MIASVGTMAALVLVLMSTPIDGDPVVSGTMNGNAQDLANITWRRMVDTGPSYVSA